MVSYIVGVTFLGMICLISLAFFVVGLFKKMSRMWIISLVVFVFGVLGTVYTSLKMVQHSVDYVGSDAFQEDTRRKYEGIGKQFGNAVTSAAKGVEETLDEKVMAALIGKGARIIGGGIKASAAAFDKDLRKTTIFPDEGLEDLGIQVGRAERLTDSVGHTYGLYLTFQQSFEGELTLTSFDSEGRKMDVSKAQAKHLGGDEKVYHFSFLHFPPGISGYCILKGTPK
jgi:hypothetical protein